MATHELTGHLAMSAPPQAVEATSAVAQRDALLAELRRLEWLFQISHEYDRPWRACPRCRGVHPSDGGKGHAPDCSLGTLLASAEWF